MRLNHITISLTVVYENQRCMITLINMKYS